MGYLPDDTQGRSSRRPPRGRRVRQVVDFGGGASPRVVTTSSQRRRRARRARRRRRLVLAATVTCLLAAGLVAGRQAASADRPPTKPVSASRLAQVQAQASKAIAAAGAPAAAPASAAAPKRAPLSLPTTTSKVQWVRSTIRVTFDKLHRSYLVFRPKYDPGGATLPVLVELSGSYVTAATEAARSNFMGVMPPAIIVYPAMVGRYWDAGACCGMAAKQHVNDVGFVAAVIHQVRASQPHAASAPVWLAGYSNGGKLAMEVACAEPQLIRAVAVYAATRTSNCTGPPPMSVLEMVGTKDPLTAIGPGSPITENGYTEPTVTALVASYLAADGCKPGASSVTAGTVTETRWSACASGYQDGVVLFGGATHVWPQTSGVTPSAQQVMWDFFASLRHP